MLLITARRFLIEMLIEESKANVCDKCFTMVIVLLRKCSNELGTMATKSQISSYLFYLSSAEWQFEVTIFVKGSFLKQQLDNLGMANVFISILFSFKKYVGKNRFQSDITKNVKYCGFIYLFILSVLFQHLVPFLL